MELSDEFVLELTQAQQRLLSYIYRHVANREQAQEVLPFSIAVSQRRIPADYWKKTPEIRHLKKSP